MAGQYKWAHEPNEADLAFIESKKWREPKFPYVLFVLPFREILDNKKHGEDRRPEDVDGLRPYEDLVAVRVDGCNAQHEKLERFWLKERGGRLITWGNFPDRSDPEARIVTPKGKETPWELIAKWAIAIVSGLEKQTQRENALLKKLEEANAREEALKSELAAEKEAQVAKKAKSQKDGK